MPSLAASLGEKYPLRRNEPLAGHTTLRIGGPAEYFFEPQRPEDLVAILNELAGANVPWRLLGGGANTLMPDGGVPGAVISTTAMRRVFLEDTALRVWPGVTLPSLVNTAAEKGLSGLELLVGVPGQVGGALAMNAGSADWGIWDAVEEVTVWFPDGRLEQRTTAEIGPGYRNGNLRGAVVVEALIQLRPDSRDAVRDRMAEHLKRKNATQPVRLSSAGCAFKNPPGESAGRLVDQSGLKGATEGDAQISELHANFIVNNGHATAAQVRTLIERAEAAVADKFGIVLERELVVVPEPAEPVRAD